jgi:sugar transferase (PEP-CTERM/EpsH1 system associated)
MTGSAVPIRSDDAVLGAHEPSRHIVSGNGLLRPQGLPVRILHVFDRLDLGGTEKVVMKLSSGLDPGLFQHSICTLRGAAPAAKSWASGVEIFDAGRPGASFQFNVLRLAKIMKQVQPTIVHSRNWGGIEAVLGARMARVPVIIHSEHGYELEMVDGLPPRQRAFRHLAYRCATAVFTVSKELRDYHAAQAWWDSNAVQVLYNGVDSEKFQPSAEVSARVRRQLGIAPNSLVVGFVGRMVPLKDVITLLRAVEDLVPTIPEIYALLVGDGPELVRLKDHVAVSPKLHGHVLFPGISDNASEMLNAMDIFVLPSLVEGMSNTLLEAMATGLPVIASRVGGNPEVVDESVCGYLFQAGNATELDMKLATLLLNREQRLEFGRAARERAIKHFSWEAMLLRYRDLYLGLAMKKGAIQRTTAHVRN